MLTVIASDADSGHNGSLVYSLATLTVTRRGQHRAGGEVCCLRVVVVVVVVVV